MPNVPAAPYERKKLADAEDVAKECSSLEEDLAALRAAYEQYFLGIERQPPVDRHKDIKRRMMGLQGNFVRQTAIKFRVQSLLQKFATYERLWARTLQEMEAGTYRRDIFKAKRHIAQRAAAGEKVTRDTVAQDAATEPDVPRTPPPLSAVATAAARPGAPATPAAVAKAPAQPPGRAGPPVVTAALAQGQRSAPAPTAAGSEGLSDTKLRAIFDAYLTAKKRCNEDVSKLSFDSVATTLRRQVPELIKQHNAKAVEFKVVIKDGKAVLRAIPK